MQTAKSVMLTNVRLAFPDLWRASRVDDSNPEEKPKYRATLLLEK